MKVIIDGDILAFAAACTEPTNERLAIARVKSLVKDTYEGCFANEEDAIIFVKGNSNFRDQYAFYKANRKGERPRTLEAVRAVLANMGTESHGGEADDYCVIKAQELKDAGEDYVIASIDKDLKQMEGKHYNYRSGEIVVVTEAQGLYWLYQQCITGDSTDGIPGIRGIGPKKSKAYLDEFTPKEHPSAVYDLYMERFPVEKEAQQALEACWNCVYMRRRLEDIKILPLPQEFYS